MAYPRQRARRTILTALICFLALGACQPAISQDLPRLLSTAAETSIADFTSGHDIDRIDLESIPVIPVFPDAQIGSEDAYASDSLYLGSSRGIDISGDTLIVSDYIQQAVLFVDTRTNQFTEKHGTVGTGPGELQKVQSAFFSGRNYMVADGNARGLNVYRTDHSFSTLIPTASQLWYSNDAGGPHLAVAAVDNAEYLLAVLSSEEPFGVKGNALPRATPPNDPADLYNTPIVALNSKGGMVAAYYGIPLLFVYDPDLLLTDIIELSSSRINELHKNSSMQSGKFRVSSWLFALALSDDGRVAFSTNAGLTILDKKNGRYRPAGTFKLQNTHPAGHGVIPFDVEFYSETSVYVVTRRSSIVYKYALNR